MDKDKKVHVIRKRHGGHGGGHAGTGGWKIAYADFMTAMMAFFLVMWLLSSATPKQLKGVAEHFRMPLKVALQGGQKSSTSASVIPGGGPVPASTDGEVAGADAREDSREVQDLKDRLEQLLRDDPVFQQFRSQLLVDITTEGLRLQIVDSEKRPMFDLASAAVAPHMRAILRELAPMLNDWPNKITVAGHTDSIVYAMGEKAYSNWELSADRANASRRELAAGGLAESKVLRVMGLADSMHLDKADPNNPVNRRISVIVLNARTQERIERENSGHPLPAPPAGFPVLPGPGPSPLPVPAGVHQVDAGTTVLRR
ncbi:MAG: flagellar motor protein MotB [Ramlibacter sp.]